MRDQHYQQAAAEMERAESRRGVSGGMHIGAAMVHALLLIAQKLDGLLHEMRREGQ